MSQPVVLKHLVTLADAVRCRMLRMLAGRELTVSEICGVLQMPQSSVSRHLKSLADDGWVSSRRDGTSRFYRMEPSELDETARGLWDLVRAQVGSGPAARQDDERVEEMLAHRRTKSREFFATEAGRWESVREELFGAAFHFRALLGLLDPGWALGDLGCGTGIVSQALSPFVRKVVAVDGSSEMLAAARERLIGIENVELRQGELERLPLRRQTLDAAFLMLVLHYLPDPTRVIVETARVLKPGGRLLIVDMLPHERTEYQQQMGHVWLGFSPQQIARMLETAGFVEARMFPLPPMAGSKGPTLFVACARRPADPGDSPDAAGAEPGSREPETAGIRFEYLETDTNKETR